MKRLKIAIETSTSCVGTCHGCALPLDLRLSQKPILNNMDEFFIGLTHFYKKLAAYHNDEFEIIVLEMVVGEHFNFETEYLEKLLLKFKAFFESTGKKYLLAISTSGLLPIEKLLPKMDVLSSVFDKNNLEVHLVCNLNQMEKYYDKYDNAFALFAQHFAYLNVLVNFDNQLAMDNCRLFAQLLQKYDIIDFQLVYGLKQHNQYKVGYDNTLFFNIYHEILKHSKQGFRQYDIRHDVEEFYEKKFNNELNLELMLNYSKKWIHEQFFVTHDGGIHHFLSTTLGDLELDTRSGFMPVASIYDEDAFEKYSNSFKSLARQLLKTYLKSEMCQNCMIKDNCYNSGLPLLSEFIIGEDICHSPVLPFYQNAEKVINNYHNIDLQNFQSS